MTLRPAAALWLLLWRLLACACNDALVAAFVPCSNYCRNPEASYESFVSFCGDLAAVGRCSVLLVSGSQRKKLDTVAVSVGWCWVVT